MFLFKVETNTVFIPKYISRLPEKHDKSQNLNKKAPKSVTPGVYTGTFRQDLTKKRTDLI